METFNFSDFIVEFPDTINYYTFEDLPHYYGIVFTFGSDNYQILHNLLMGYRLIINNLQNFSCRDIPFKKETTDFLPADIKVIWK